MKFVAILRALLATGAMTLYGCMFGGVAGPTSLELAQLASAVAEYHSEATLAVMGRLEVSETQEAAARVSSMLPVSSSSVGTQALIIDEEVYVLPDGTEVTIVRMLDDRDTADPEDDLLTITRSFEMWEGATKTHQIQRPRPPESSWSGWEDDRLTQAGTIEVYVEGIMIQHGTVDVTWQRAGDLVTVAAIEQELTAVDPAGGIVRTMITVDDAGLQQKTVYRISISDGYEIIVHSFTFEEIEVDGVIKTKIVRDDGRYAIVERARDPRVVEHYHADGKLHARVTTVRNRSTGERTITRELFDEAGNLVHTQRLAVQFRFLGDQIVVTATFASGRTVDVVIRERDDGYEVVRDGITYVVRFTDAGIEFYGPDGELIGTVIIDDDGGVTVVTPEGEAEQVNLA